MMAFFLLMWLLNATTEEQRRGLADYFAPSNLFSHGSSGTGDPFSGHTALDQGSMVSDRGAVQVVPGNRPAATEEGDAAAQQASVAGDADREAGSSANVRPQAPGRPPAGPAGFAHRGRMRRLAWCRTARPMVPPPASQPPRRLRPIRWRWKRQPSRRQPARSAPPCRAIRTWPNWRVNSPST